MTSWAKLALGLALVGICASRASGQSEARPEVNQPFEIVRSIQAIQDQVVRGNDAARARLPKLIGQMAQRLLIVDRDVWRDPRNASAAVIYTLSGGQPRVIRKVIETGLSPEPERTLMRGVLAYVEGHEAEARKLLGGIDARTSNLADAGYIAMIQSALLAKEDPGKAMQLLDEARILAPGTLVEETALRRELVLADEIADINRFAFLSNEYIWRFHESAYFKSFRQHFVSSVVHFGRTVKPTQYSELEQLVGQMNAAGQLGLYLLIAHNGIIEGEPGIVRFAAGKAVHLSADGSVERERSKFYEAAALILTDEFEKGVDELGKVDASRLPKEDSELEQAVASMAKLIGKNLGSPQGPVAPDQDEHSTALQGESPATASVSTLIDLAQRQLGQTDAVLERKAP